MSPYVRTVQTSSGATAVQIVHKSRDIEHLGSARDEVELELLKAVARQRLAAGQGELDLGLAVGVPGGPLPITSSRMGHLLDSLGRAYRLNPSTVWVCDCLVAVAGSAALWTLASRFSIMVQGPARAGPG